MSKLIDVTAITEYVYYGNDEAGWGEFPDEADDFDDFCESKHDGWLCTRLANHEHAHVAGLGGGVTCAAWPQEA